MSVEINDIKINKILGVTNLVLIILLWVFVITVNDIRGKAIDKAEDLEDRVELLESRVETVETLHTIDTIVVNMCIQDYIKVKNNIKK